MTEPEEHALIASVPEALRRAIHAHVREDQQMEVLLDVADALAAMRLRGEQAGIAVYVSETIASLSMDRDTRKSF